jgi:hypothetical protein
MSQQKSCSPAPKTNAVVFASMGLRPMRSRWAGASKIAAGMVPSRGGPAGSSSSLLSPLPSRCHREGVLRVFLSFCGLCVAERNCARSAGSTGKSSGGPNGIRTRVCCPPRAFSIWSTSCVMLTQHPASGDPNSAGILVPRRASPRARSRLSLTERDTIETFLVKLGLRLGSGSGAVTQHD